MEARLGFGASIPPPPAYKFDPTDADIVAHYLLPRAAAGLPSPHAHAVVVDADPCSCPPWELLRRHAHAGGNDRAFFFGPVPERTKAGRRVANRAVSGGEEGGGGGGGGTWVLQRSAEDSLVLQRGGGADEIELRYKKTSLNYRSNDDARTTGWVMDEYEITDPPAPLHGGVLSRVRITARGKSKFQNHQAAAAAAAKKLAPGTEEPGPSGPVAANYVVMGHGEGPSGGGAQAEAVHDSGGFLGEMAGYYSALPSAGEDGGYSGDNSNGYCSEGSNGYFSNNYCFDDCDASSDYFL